MQEHPLKSALKDYPGGRPQFCKDATISEGRLSQILGGERPSPELAMTIHRLTNGTVPASELRPDLWRSPNDVPVQEAAE
jgi:DNA-binding transcriptional regulator YdaS (Cro superfamily)